MKTLVDNTGMHSALKPFLKNDYSEIDLYGLLQFCVSIIFSDEIIIDVQSTKTNVFENTQLSINKLIEFGFDNSIFKLIEYDDEKKEILLKKAAEEISDEVNFSFLPNLTNLRGSYPDGVGSNFFQKGIRFAELCINEKDNQMQLENILEKWKIDRGVDFIEYIIAISPSLRESIKFFMNNNKPKDIDIYQLNIFIRYKINEFIAQDNDAIYIPSVARAKLVRSSEQLFFYKIEKKLDHLISEVKGIEVVMPSIMDFLLNKSKGNFNKLIETTLELREKASSLRKLLNNILDNKNIYLIENKFLLDRELDKIIDLVRYDLDISKPRLNDVFTITNSKPFFNVKQGNLIEWLKYRRDKDKVSVLTEVSKFAMYNDIQKKSSILLKLFRK